MRVISGFYIGLGSDFQTQSLHLEHPHSGFGFPSAASQKVLRAASAIARSAPLRLASAVCLKGYINFWRMENQVQKTISDEMEAGFLQAAINLTWV